MSEAQVKKEVKRRYVGLWANVDKNENPYLSGTDKEHDTRYFVFSDKDDPSKKRLAKSIKGRDIVTIGDLSKRSSDHGDFLSTGDYIVSGNRFYDESDPFIRNQNKEYVLNANGEKIPQPEYQVSFPIDL